MVAAQGELTTDPIGIDIDAVTGWLLARVDWLAAPLRWIRLPGGHSNFTYRVEDAAGHAFVLRRPPLGELLPSAHDMGREWKLISALWPTAVPVPEPVAYCDDESVTGARFFAMGFVEGRPLYSIEDTEEHLDVAARGRTGDSFMRTLAALHALDPDEIGLGDLGKRDSYVGRQLKRWYQSWNASKTTENPDVDRLSTWLVERLPEQGRVSVVHGDYGLHNCRIAADGTVAAVVDWEISTLGDPLADLAYALNAWLHPGEPTAREVAGPTQAPGFGTRDELIATYEEASGTSLSEIEYYRAFNHWKTACIVQGVYARYLQGQKDGVTGEELEEMPRRIAHAVDLAVDAARTLGY
ncbi:MAG: phosphotransferase family protein [Acidimicrobiia bacterium]|nr:phosphotransferase family protein [Acidimicrobiia bacterium]